MTPHQIAPKKHIKYMEILDMGQLGTQMVCFLYLFMDGWFMNKKIGMASFDQHPKTYKALHDSLYPIRYSTRSLYSSPSLAQCKCISKVYQLMEVATCQATGKKSRVDQFILSYWMRNGWPNFFFNLRPIHVSLLP